MIRIGKDDLFDVFRAACPTRQHRFPRQYRFNLSLIFTDVGNPYPVANRNEVGPEPFPADGTFDGAQQNARFFLQLNRKELAKRANYDAWNGVRAEPGWPLPFESPWLSDARLKLLVRSHGTHLPMDSATA